MRAIREGLEDDSAKIGGAGAARSRLRASLRWLPLALLAAALVAFYGFGLPHYLSLAALRSYHETLAAFVAARPLLASSIYVLVYAASVAVSFPGASFFTIAGGFLFGAGLGTGLAAIAATIGATAVFLAARTSLGGLLAAHAGPRLQRLSEGFRQDGFSYLLSLRLVPLFPFWLVNLAAALFGMRLAHYVAATAIGILPGTFVFAYFGSGLETSLESPGSPVTVELVVALLLLGLVALLPAVVRRWRRKRAASP